MGGSVSFNICEGNPGAVAFVMSAYDPKNGWSNIVKAEAAFKRMERAGITGSKLYMLWNNCCNRDTDKAIEIMQTKDIDDIVKHINFENGRGYAFE